MNNFFKKLLLINGVILGFICVGGFLFDIKNTVYLFIALSLSLGCASYACVSLVFKIDADECNDKQ